MTAVCDQTFRAEDAVGRPSDRLLRSQRDVAIRFARKDPAVLFGDLVECRAGKGGNGVGQEGFFGGGGRRRGVAFGLRRHVRRRAGQRVLGDVVDGDDAVLDLCGARQSALPVFHAPVIFSAAMHGEDVEAQSERGLPDVLLETGFALAVVLRARELVVGGAVGEFVDFGKGAPVQVAIVRDAGGIERIVGFEDGVNVGTDDEVEAAGLKPVGEGKRFAGDLTDGEHARAPDGHGLVGIVRANAEGFGVPEVEAVAFPVGAHLGRVLRDVLDDFRDTVPVAGAEENSGHAVGAGVCAAVPGDFLHAGHGVAGFAENVARIGAPV